MNDGNLNSKPMKTLVSLFALALLSHIGFSQVVVQQQTVTRTTNQFNPGFQLGFNAWNPMNSFQNNNGFVWDPFTNMYVQPNQGDLFLDQFGNPMQTQQNLMYVDQFGNPIHTQQATVYVDQFGNQVQPQQNITYIDQFGNQVTQQQQVMYYDQFGNIIQNQVFTDPFLPAAPMQVQPIAPQGLVGSPINSAFPMNPNSFSQVLSQIRGQNFESTRLTLARQILGSNWFTSEQIRSMMTQMTFEDSKVEVARLGYNRVVDPQNYFQVNSAFTFSSSVEELNRYLFGQ